jgi:hypothetical protein
MTRKAAPSRIRTRRRFKKEQWSTIAGAILLERNALPEDSPRRKPTLARVRWMEREVRL